MSRVIFFLILCFPALGANTLTRWGVTWTFDKELSADGAGDTYQTGTFVNGDPWIKGPVNITEITPEPECYHNTHLTDYYAWINGSMVNPSNLHWAKYKEIGETAITDPQYWDERVNNLYLPNTATTLPTGWIDPESGTPYALAVGSSLISVNCYKYEDSDCPTAWTTVVYKKCMRPCVRSAAVLTCLASAPAANSFRPAYAGTDKTILHNKSDIDTASVLPSPRYAAVTGTPTYATCLARIDRFQGPDLPFSSNHAFLHPAEHMTDYPEDFATYWGDIFCRSLVTGLTTGSGSEEETLAIHLCQMGIDFYGICANGGGWSHQGGGFPMGRKLPILFAGAVLNYAPYLAIGDAVETGGFGLSTVMNKAHARFEDCQIFYISQVDINRFGTENRTVTRTNCRVAAGDLTTIIDDGAGDFSLCDDGETHLLMNSSKSVYGYDYWVVWKDDTGNEETIRAQYVNYGGAGMNTIKLRDPVSAAASGQKVRIQLYPQERRDWPDWAGGTSYDHYTSPTYDGSARNYRWCCTSRASPGNQLFALVAKNRAGTHALKYYWNWNAYFDYQDLYMGQTFTDLTQRGSTFSQAMWDAYRVSKGGALYSAPGPPDPESGNILPTLTPPPGPITGTVGTLMEFTITGTDLNTGDTLTLTASNLPAGVTFTPQSPRTSPITGVYSRTPTAPGTFTPTFRVSDGTGYNEVNVSITVNATAQPPKYAPFGK